jgi:hypothetical protein
MFQLLSMFLPLPLPPGSSQTATLTNEGKDDAHPIKAMKFSVSPVVRVAVEPKVGLRQMRAEEWKGGREVTVSTWCCAACSIVW